MKKRIYILIAIVNLVLVNFMQGQDLHMSQFFETPLLRNPALAGIFEGDDGEERKSTTRSSELKSGKRKDQRFISRGPVNDGDDQCDGVRLD